MLAVDSPANPERPALARIFFSQMTDSVPFAWRFRRLPVQGGGGEEDGRHEHALRVMAEPLQQRHPDLLQLQRPGSGSPGPAGVAAVHEHQEGGKERHHGEPGQHDAGAGDEAELFDAAEVGQRQDVEGPGGRQRSQEHPRAGPCRGELQGLLEVSPEEELLLVPEEEVDAVVDPDSDDDGDEHHGEDREVADEQRDDAQRPAEAQREHGEHRTRGHEPPEREH